MSTTLIILVVLGVVVLYVIFAYNSFIAKVNQVKNAWADIDVQFKRRYDLIPNLINTVKGAANFESSTLEKVVQARNMAMTAHDTGDKDQISGAENMLSGTLKSLFALSESYPDLKATKNFSDLQMELSDTENKIMAARRFYNSVVMSLNTSVQSFPGNIIAKIFSFNEEKPFALDDADNAAKNPVAVSF